MFLEQPIKDFLQCEIMQLIRKDVKEMSVLYFELNSSCKVFTETSCFFSWEPKKDMNIIKINFDNVVP